MGPDVARRSRVDCVLLCIYIEIPWFGGQRSVEVGGGLM